MKYGLLYYKDTDNIGDDIQTYAQSRFLPRIDYMIDREKLNDFVPEKKEYVKTIMNAWYIHDYFNFDISPYIYPLLVSMFFKRVTYKSGITVNDDYINENVRNTLRKYGPVGARDDHTRKLMKDLNVESYFSGCLTLTLDKFEGVKKEDYIVVNGLTKDEVKYIKSITKRKVIEFHQDVKRGSFSNETWKKREERVIETLKLYQGAHMVITTKLHCSLPCLALETPVLLLYDDSKSENIDRIGTYITYLNHVNRKNIGDITSEIIEAAKPNPKKYCKLRNDLISKCKNFIKKEIKIDSKNLPEISDYSLFLERSTAQKDVILKHLNKLCNLYEYECKKSSQMYDELQRLQIIENEMDSIKSSRSYKIMKLLSRIYKKCFKKNNNYIKVDDILTKGHKLIIKYSYSGNVSQFFEKNMDLVIEYDFDLNDIPKSILVIPFISLFLPVAWITKSTFIVDEIDKDYFDNIIKCRKSFNEMYKSSIFKRIKFKYNKKVKNTIEDNNSSLFFSGGVDSLNTLVNHYKESKKPPILIMIWGSDIW